MLYFVIRQIQDGEKTRKGSLHCYINVQDLGRVP